MAKGIGGLLQYLFGFIPAGQKTYVAAVGLICFAIYQATTGQYESAISTFLAALATFGMRSAISDKQDPQKPTT